jgi:hypothetical protein
MIEKFRRCTDISALDVVDVHDCNYIKYRNSYNFIYKELVINNTMANYI